MVELPTGTENVTVLFTDLVGSRELAAALSPEAGDELRPAHFSLSRQAVAASGGTEVKNLVQRQAAARTGGWRGPSRSPTSKRSSAKGVETTLRAGSFPV